MSYSEQPSDDPRIEAIWTHVPDASLGVEPHLVPPDACVDMIVEYRRSLMWGAVAPRVRMHRPSHRFHLAKVRADVVLVGVRFAPGVAGQLLTLSASEALLLAADLPDSWRSTARVESVARAVLDARRSPPALVTDFIAATLEAGGGRLTRLRRGLAVHERALERAAAAWLGMSPKQYTRLVRIDAAKHWISQGVALAEVAADLGFADQAHLTRDFREQLGCTPRSFCRDSSIHEEGVTGRAPA
jgi:AraC-like DNA-binding protein